MSPLSNTINAIDRQKNHIFTNYLSFRGSQLLNLSDHIGAILSKQCRISPYLVTDAFSQKTPLVFNSKYPNFFCNSNFEENIQFRLKNYHDCSSCSALTCGNHIGDYIDQIVLNWDTYTSSHGNVGRSITTHLNSLNCNMDSDSIHEISESLYNLTNIHKN